MTEAEEKEILLAQYVLKSKLCKDDPLMFIDTFCYTFNPKVEPYHLPFKLFPFQKAYVLQLKKAIDDGYDFFAEKCREMGITYTTLATLLWYWLYVPGSNFLLGSRKEDYVDNRGGSKGDVSNKEESLFGKLEYMIQRLPKFLLPKKFSVEKNMTFMSLTNPENGNVISGESSNSNFSRGGRFKAIFLDEFAFWDNDCLKKDTEVLTDSGWKLIKDCTTKDLVYSMNTENMETLFMPVTKLHKVYAPQLYEFKSKSVDISCTPNHKLLLEKKYKVKNTRIFVDNNKDKPYWKQSNGQRYFRRADEVYKQKHDFIPLTSNYIGGLQPKKIYGFKAEDFMEFLGWFVSEGYHSGKTGDRRIGICQSKAANPQKWKEIKEMLLRMKLNVTYNSGSFNFGVTQLPKKMFEELWSLGKAHEKYIPQKYLNYSEILLNYLFNALISGDGCVIERPGKTDKISYFTVSKRLADNFQELTQKCGFKATISKTHYINGKWRDLYRINVGFKTKAQVACLDKNIVDYNDYAYCVTTPYHSLYIRRNGIACWVGNTASWGSTADTTNCRIVVTTPGIKPSKAKRLRFGEDGEEIKVVSFDYTLDPRKTNDWLEKERRRRSTEDFAREIMINWEASIQGIVYPEIALASVGSYPYDPVLALYCSWDFGLDGLAINWWQYNPKNGKPRLIDSYFNSNKPIPFYFPFMGHPVDSTFEYSEEDILAINAFKNFKKAIHFGDPDVKKRSLHTAISTRQILNSKGIYIQTNTAANEFEVRRERTKVLLQGGIEVNDTKRNLFWLDCIKQARYPQRDENAQGTSPINKPIHNFTSHHRTALEYFAVNFDLSTVKGNAEVPDWVSKIPKWTQKK